MPATLVVEDGSGVANADSYVSRADAVSWLALRGLSLGASEAADEILLRQAMDFLESLRDRYSGWKTESTQALQWPREGASLDGVALETNVIPAVLWQAQARLAVYAKTTPLMPSGDGRAVSSESVGPVSTSYTIAASSNPQPALTEAWRLLAPLLKGSTYGGLVTERA